MVDGYNGTARERIDRSCDLLSSSYRRRVIYALRKDGPASVGEIAEAVVASGIADVRERAVASLVHTHLPKLAEFDVVEYDDPNDDVALADNLEFLEPFLSVAAREEAESERLPVAGTSTPEVPTQNLPD